MLRSFELLARVPDAPLKQLAANDHDVVAWLQALQVLTPQGDFQTARKYWNQLKRLLEKEGRQSVTSCHRLKLPVGGGDWQRPHAVGEPKR